MKLVSKGDILQRVFQVVNQGSGVARNMQAILNIPNGYKFNKAIIPVGYISEVNGTKVWNLGDQPSGSVHAIDLYLEVSDDCALGAEMNIYVRSDSPDPNISNNLLQFNLPWIGCCNFKECFGLDKDLPDRDILRLSDFDGCYLTIKDKKLILNNVFFVSDQSQNNTPETYNGPTKTPSNPMEGGYVMEVFADGTYWWQYSCNEDPDTLSYSLKYSVSISSVVSSADLYINESDAYLESAIAATEFSVKPANSVLSGDFEYVPGTGVLKYIGSSLKKFLVILSVEAYFTDNATAPIEVRKNNIPVSGMKFQYLADGTRFLIKSRSRVISLEKDDEITIIAEASVTNDYEFYDLNLTITEA